MLHHTRIPSKTSLLFCPTAQICSSCWRQTRVNVIQTGSLTHRRHSGSKFVLRRCCVQHVVRSDTPNVVAIRDACKLVVAHRVEWVAVIPHFHHHAVPTERRNKLLHSAFCHSWSMRMQCTRRHTTATTSKYPPVANREIGKLFNTKYWLLFTASKLPRANCARQMCVPSRVARDHHDVAHCFANTALQLCTKHCWQPECASSLRKPNNAVQPVAIGKCK